MRYYISLRRNVIYKANQSSSICYVLDKSPRLFNSLITTDTLEDTPNYFRIKDAEAEDLLQKAGLLYGRQSLRQKLIEAF